MSWTTGTHKSTNWGNTDSSSTNWGGGTSKSTDWSGGTSKSTDFTAGTHKSTAWGFPGSRDFSHGYLLLQTGSYILQQNGYKLALQ